MGQTWDDLLFAHWRVPFAPLRQLVPEALELDTFDGAAWLGMTPFRVTGLRLRGLLPVPRVSCFLELNVRTYVRYRGERPGIWFFSLDASSPLAVQAARRFYRLPYFRARMSQSHRHGGWIEYSSSREEVGRDPFVWAGRYRSRGPIFEAARGSLEYFLAERYCLYAEDESRTLYRADIHHAPWPLQEAEAAIELNTMAPTGLELPDEPPLLHLSARQDVVIWPLEPVQAEAASSASASRM